MNTKFRKAAALTISMLMLIQSSACSGYGSLLSVPGAAGANKSEQAETTESETSATDIEGNIVPPEENKYNEGISLYKSGKFREAQAYFEACGDYKCAKDLVRVCEAENEFSKGNYEAAKSYYSAVSENADVPGLSIQARKANIETRITLEKMTGNYYPSYNKITMDKYKKKKVIGWWHNVGTWGQQYLTISYAENEDGTFDVTGEVQFMRYTKYAKKKSGIKQGPYKLPISLKNISQFPEKIQLAKGVSLAYKRTGFELNYSKTDTNKKQKTKVVYKSQVTYKKS